MLITRADLRGRGLADVRIESSRVVQIGDLTAYPDEVLLDADGGALLPGLHDDHIHLLSYAASLDSVCCGPPDVTNEDALIVRGRAGAQALRQPQRQRSEECLP